MNFRKTHPDAVTPFYATPGAAAFDFTATTKEETEYYIEYGTGIELEIPVGYVGLLFPRSSVTNMDLTLKNCVGVIDSDYRGEIKFRFQYSTGYIDECVTETALALRMYLESKSMDKALAYYYENASRIIQAIKEYKVGDKIGQMVILPILQVELTEVTELSSTGRTGGFGSTGQ